MSKPVRVQRKRSKGWRMPPNTVYVGRGSPFGNPFLIGLVHCGCRSAGECDHNMFRCSTTQEAVDAYRQLLDSATNPRTIARRETLRGKNLACWCPLDQPCHADVLLELANVP